MADLGRPTLSSLRDRLARRHVAVLADVAWPGPPIMRAVSSSVAELLDARAPETVDVARLTRAVRRLQDNEHLPYAEVVICCLGAGVQVEIDGAVLTIIDNTTLTMLLTNALALFAEDSRRTPRLAFAVTHALTSLTEEPVGPRRANLLELAAFAVEASRVPSGEQRSRRSVEQLAAVEPLLRSLSVGPYLPYVTNLDDGAVSPLIRLGVPPASWVWKAVVTGGLRTASLDGDGQYLRRTSEYVELAQRHPSALDAALGLILNRLAKARSTPDQPKLRELVVARWGDPRQRAAIPDWERWAAPEARRLVASWMTRLVIDGFFESLSGPGGDPARAAFWGRYAMAIDELWVYTSVDARRSRGPVVAELRANLGGNVQRMRHPTANAFAMRIGEYVFLEFSEKGNALFIYRANAIPFDLNESDLRPADMRDQDLASGRIVHGGHWQDKATDGIGTRTGVWPSR